MTVTRIRKNCLTGTVILCPLGAAVMLLLPSVDFMGLILFGLGCLCGCYWLLFTLEKKHRSLARILCILLSLLCGVGFIAAFFTGSAIGKACKGDADREFTYLLVLGCGVNGTEPSRSLKDRIDAAYGYLAAHPDVICIVSGGKGSGERISEAQCMFNELTAMGIPAERIWMEDKATSTRENFDFSLDLIEAKTGSRPEEMGVLSSEYHLYRAKMFAREQAITAYGVPAKTSYRYLFVNYFLREIVMVWYYSTVGAA